MSNENKDEQNFTKNLNRKLNEDWVVVCPMIKGKCSGPKCPMYLHRKITADGTMSGVCALSATDPTELRIVYDAQLDAYLFAKPQIENAEPMDKALMDNV